jgi:hypothetical protein
MLEEVASIALARRFLEETRQLIPLSALAFFADAPVVAVGSRQCACRSRCSESRERAITQGDFFIASGDGLLFNHQAIGQLFARVWNHSSQQMAE